MYEHLRQPLISRKAFLKRQAWHAFFAFGIICVSLLIGILGYRIFEGMAFIDCLLNAAMILGGMGPVSVLHTNAGKMFASIYALYSGIVFLVVAGVLVAPAFHRLLHHFHMERESEDRDA